MCQLCIVWATCFHCVRLFVSHLWYIGEYDVSVNYLSPWEPDDRRGGLMTEWERQKEREKKDMELNTPIKNVHLGNLGRMQSLHALLVSQLRVQLALWNVLLFKTEWDYAVTHFDATVDFNINVFAISHVPNPWCCIAVVYFGMEREGTHFRQVNQL